MQGVEEVVWFCCLFVCCTAVGGWRWCLFLFFVGLRLFVCGMVVAGGGGICSVLD